MYKIATASAFLSLGLSLSDLATALSRGECPPGLEFTETPTQAPALSLDDSGYEASLYQFFYFGKVICKEELRELYLQEDQRFRFGEIPAFDAPLAEDPGPTHTEVAEFIKHQLKLENYDLLSEPKSCWYLRNRQLIPAWAISLRVGVMPQKIWATAEEILDREPLSFDLDGRAEIYANNVLDGALDFFQLSDLDGSGYLRNNWFETSFEDSQYRPAYSSDLLFSFNPGSTQFAETSLFTNAMRTLIWFSANGYAQFGNRKITIVPHSRSTGTVNNAQYTPSIDGNPPMILIGDGDGTVLQNLATDADVVSHEFAHHVVYQSLKSLKGETLVLHEGLADFFTFMRTNNPCLGESICPVNSPLNCAKAAECLRTAENQYRLDSQDLPESAHERSQLISGLMWDLKVNYQIDNTDLTRIVLDALGYMISNSGYRHFLAALLLADKKLQNGRYCETIKLASKSRGFSRLVNDFDCAKEIPLPKDLGGLNSDPDVNVKRKGVKPQVCGILGHSNSEGTPWVLAWFFLALLPWHISRRSRDF